MHCFGEKRFGENGGGDIGLVREGAAGGEFYAPKTELHQMNDPLPVSFLLLVLTSAPNAAPLFLCQITNINTRRIVSNQGIFGACTFSPPWCKHKLQVIACWHHFCQCTHQYLPTCCEAPFAPGALWHLHQNGAPFFASKDASPKVLLD